MRKVKLSAPMTPRELAQHLGWPTDRKGIKKLIRCIKRKERALGQQIFWRLPDRRLQTTVAVLRYHMPELIETRDEVSEKLKEMVESLEEKIAALARTDRVIGANVRRLRTRVVLLEGGGPRRPTTARDSG